MHILEEEMDNRPIGVFDSGFGGLTVAKGIMNQLPDEEIVYFGDTARIPYGSKSKDTIIKYSNQIIRFLKTKDVKAIVIACGTASALALEAVREKFDLPIIGIVEPAARAAAQQTRNNKIGIIGTEATIASNIYDMLIQKQAMHFKAFSKACPLFVPLVEEGWLDDEITGKVAERYLSPLREKEVDTLILGCTHYPLLSEVIHGVMGDGVELINPAIETAKDLEKLLMEKNLMGSHENPEHRFYVSDFAHKFESFGEMMIKRSIAPVKQIAIEEY